MRHLNVAHDARPHLNPANVRKSHNLPGVLDLFQKPNVMFGQAVRSSTIPKQCEVPERRDAVVIIALDFPPVFKRIFALRSKDRKVFRS